MQLAYDAQGYINWPLILSYDAYYTIVIDARTRGKTFGLRYQCAMRDYPKRGKRFVELVRTKEQLKGTDALQVGYFDKMRDALPNDRQLSRYLLDTQGRRARIAERPKKDDAKPKWDTLGYYLALSDAGTIKNRSNSFSNVRRFIFDEALLDRRIDKVHKYLPGEIEAVASIMTSVSRENKNTADADRPRLYLLGNAVDLTCPWLAHFGITDVPPYGFSWHFDHRCLLWYGPPDDEWASTQGASVSGALVAQGAGAAANMRNEFTVLDASYFADVPKGAMFSFGVAYQGDTFGVWCDMREGYYYVREGLPKSLDGRPVYALTASDARPNYIMARRAQKSLKGFVELYYMGVVRYASHDVRARFLQALALFGVR
jgi:hypothetical protein